VEALDYKTTYGRFTEEISPSVSVDSPSPSSINNSDDNCIKELRSADEIDKKPALFPYHPKQTTRCPGKARLQVPKAHYRSTGIAVNCTHHSFYLGRIWLPGEK